MDASSQTQGKPEQNVESPARAEKSSWVESGRQRASEFMPLVVLVVLVLVIGLVQPSFLSLYSMRVLAGESAVILLMAIGETIVILLGGIDLSLAALASLGSVLLAYWLPPLGWLGLLLMLGFVTLAGALQGVIHAKAQVPSFVVTLAGMGLWGGIAITIAHTTIPVNKGFEVVGWLKGSTGGVPHSFAFAVVVLLIMAAALRWLPLGRYVYAIGLAEPAAIVSGIRTTRIKILAYTLSGLLAGLTAMVMVARTYGGNPTIANALAASCHRRRRGGRDGHHRGLWRAGTYPDRCAEHHRYAGRHCRNGCGSRLRAGGLRPPGNCRRDSDY